MSGIERKRIACFGECMVELSDVKEGLCRLSYGGDTLNTALYLSRFKHHEVHYVSALGKERLSDDLLAAWRLEGIFTDLVLRDENRHVGIYKIEVDEKGERSFLYWRSNSAARYILSHPEWPFLETHLMQMDWLYLSGISLAVLPPEARPSLFDFIERFKCKGGKIAFDNNYRASLWNSLEEARQNYQKMLPFLDLALFSFEDEQKLWCDQSLDSVFLRLKTIPQVVIKAGKEGAFYQEKTKVVHVLALPSVCVDTTAAGDSFNAAFLDAYLSGASVSEAVNAGNRLAAKVVAYRGAVLPMKEEDCEI